MPFRTFQQQLTVIFSLLLSHRDGVRRDLRLCYNSDGLDGVVPDGACHGQPNLRHGGIQPHPRAQTRLRWGTDKPSGGFDTSLRNTQGETTVEG